MKAIEELHVKPEWTSRYHGTEALKDKAKCLLCHQSEGECDECHLQRPAFHGSTDTWIGRHTKQAKAWTTRAASRVTRSRGARSATQQFKEME